MSSSRCFQSFRVSVFMKLVQVAASTKAINCLFAGLDSRYGFKVSNES